MKGRHLVLIVATAAGLAASTGAGNAAQSCDPSYPAICAPPGSSPCAGDLPLVPAGCGDPCADDPAIYIAEIKLPDACVGWPTGSVAR